MSIQNYRKVCRGNLVLQGYAQPVLYFDRKEGCHYYSYWGCDERRMEVIYDGKNFEVRISELAYVKEF